MLLSCLKMRVQIWGYLGQMAHRRQIAQWAGTRTTHPGGTGVRDQNQGVRVPIPAGVFYAPKNTPQGFFVAKNLNFVSKT